MKTRLPSNDPQGDPRKALDRSDLGVASVNALPQVASKSTLKDSLVLAGGIMGAVFLGALTLVFMNNNRQAAQIRPPQTQPAQPMPPQQGQNGTVVELPPVALPEGPPVAQPQPPQTGGAAPVADANNARANALIYDVSAPDPDPTANAAQAPAPAQKAEGNVMDGNSVTAMTSLDPTRQVRATRITTPSRTVSQGTLIPAVLETALNSDLPGYTRALVSRDVRSFDGSRVLIPRGSRLIGSYRSGLQSGQNRLFITWARLIRPDGTAIVLTDPSTDNLGQAGQTGDIDTHFFKRFGSAMLLSIIGGLANSSSSGDRNTIVIGTAQGANNAATAALQADSKIGPTVRVAQGTPIQVFVSRDLDFSL
ncbi:TrbI/VirB10 family protein [Asticcacaulis excentricus]|uniref:Conjugation TrbI family protein n=1 Tax=Asticcacaulis excentricus (strain ATCC 15261 / DSM 4724 / KCTC 12464 / NCIMB 9791 / VKM B-1370 / CB 48) TaxID=573065 RepID=E8RP32_ASTEC|nr:TrbI/VirB10 family protein [Asticcacaulis excentricus]ADU13002.1 conjugation TrbI family protein [Asticcacaulis excentricus CB 48]